MIDDRFTAAASAAYFAPQCEVVGLDSVAVLCQSGGAEDYYIVDPWN